MAVRTAEKERKKSQKLLRKESLELRDDPPTPGQEFKAEHQFSDLQVPSQQYRVPVKDDYDFISSGGESDMNESKSSDLVKTSLNFFFSVSLNSAKIS